MRSNRQKHYDRTKMREYDASLRKIAELREQLEVASELFSTTPPKAHPILVQKNPFQAKK
jgi:hypothetical protein